LRLPVSPRLEVQKRPLQVYTRLARGRA